MTREEVLYRHSPLTQEQLKSVDFDNFTTNEIMCLVVRGIIDEEDVNEFYGNEIWKQDLP